MRIFVYGTLKKGYGLHQVLDGCRFLGLAYTVKSHTLLDCGVPVMVPVDSVGGTIVQGEVYEITSPELIKRLDQIEGAYDRTKIKVEMASGRIQTVHAYIGKPGWRRGPVALHWLKGMLFNFERGENA
jgi:gamma-glutamylcyclotransferase (GGCT)/AIG2-like uncharacterized protein YtfP